MFGILFFYDSFYQSLKNFNNANRRKKQQLGKLKFNCVKSTL